MNNSFIKDVNDALVSLSRKFLSDFGKEVNIDKEDNFMFFLGGSKLFGYNDEKSDIDLFVYVNEDQISKFIQSLENNEFGLEYKEARDYPVNYLFVNKRYNIHILIIENKDAFLKLKKEHIMVSTHLDKFPYIPSFIKALKKQASFEIKGKLIYRSLLAEAKKHNKKENNND